MNIILQDNQGLVFALSMDGFQQITIIEAKNNIRKIFREIAQTVFSGVLEKSLPENIEIQMVQSKDDELNGKESAVMASFNSELSDHNHLVFNVHEITVKEIIADFKSKLFLTVVIHEMIHAADLPHLRESRSKLRSIYDEINAEQINSIFQTKNNKWALVGVLYMLDHYRAEGIAILGECLLAKNHAVRVKDPYGVFCKTFLCMVMNARNWAITTQSNPNDLVDDETFAKAYVVSPYIITAVLGRCGKLDKDMVIKITRGFLTGAYDLSQDEAYMVIRSALSLSIVEYIEGLLLMGDKIAPIKGLLELCGILQGHIDENYVNAFDELLNAPQTIDAFNKAMSEIMGVFMPDDELKTNCQEFIKNPPDAFSDQKIMDKIGMLLSVLENGNDNEKKNIARWALTYLFDDEDAINDDICTLGYIDDIIVIDNALCLINN